MDYSVNWSNMPKCNICGPSYPKRSVKLCLFLCGGQYNVPLILEGVSPHTPDNTEEAYKLHLYEETSTFMGFTSHPLAGMCLSKATRVLATSYSPDQMGLKDLTRRPI